MTRVTEKNLQAMGAKTYPTLTKIDPVCSFEFMSSYVDKIQNLSVRKYDNHGIKGEVDYKYPV